MATYKISYISGDSYLKKGEVYISDVLDENDAIEMAIYKEGLDSEAKVMNVELICE
jgi:hypothetical protein